MGVLNLEWDHVTRTLFRVESGVTMLSLSTFPLDAFVLKSSSTG